MYGQQENSAYNGHFESTCYHPLLLFNAEGDCLAAKLRPGNVHSAEDWTELLLPEIERQQELGKEVVFRADAAFAKPEIYEALEERGVKYANQVRLGLSVLAYNLGNLWRRLALPKRIGRSRVGLSFRDSSTSPASNPEICNTSRFSGFHLMRLDFARLRRKETNRNRTTVQKGNDIP